MNVRLGSVSAAEAIGIANASYRNAQATGDSGFVSTETGDSAWAALISGVFKAMTPQAPNYVSPAPAAKPSAAPYLIAGGVGLAAILILK